MPSTTLGTRADSWTGTFCERGVAQKSVIRFITSSILYKEPAKVGDVDQIGGRDEQKEHIDFDICLECF